MSIGLAKMLHEKNGHYKSLISGIGALFHHLESEINVQSSVSQLLLFTSMYNDLSNAIIEKYKLLIFGNGHSSLNFYDLLGDLKIDSFYKSLNQSFYGTSDSFTLMRAAQRLLNGAIFSTERGNLDDKFCKTQIDSCFCTYYHVRVSIPKISRAKKCLVKLNSFKFKHEESIYLAHSNQAVTLSKDQDSGKLLKQLQPPVIQLQKGIDAFFVTQNRILFPFAANHTINKKCYSDRGSGNVSETEIQIKSGTILTIDKNCNYSSSFLTCFYQGSFSESHVNDTQEIFLPKLSPGFNFS